MSTIAKKLQMKPGQYWLLYNAPANYLSLLEPLPEGAAVSYSTNGEFDGIQLFVKNSQELMESLKVIAPLLKPNTVFWISSPKKSSGIESDLGMMGDWSTVTQYGYEPVAAAAIDHVWTASRFRPIGQAKLSNVGNEEIKTNEYGAWIDVDNKIITLPDNIKHALEQMPQALANYEKLSYSNRKEYVLWILTAKQDKTREERLVKMVEKLVAGKKNPAEK